MDDSSYQRHNESTDSFLATHTLSVVSLRLLNPNLQTVDEKTVKRLNTVHKVQRTVDRKPSQRYSLSPPRSTQLTPSTTQETTDIDHLKKTMRAQNFWKYHIISIGKNQMYLTTNPDIKHLYCRNGPGYFVQLVLPRLPKTPSHPATRQSDMGFRLVFKQQVYDELDNEDNLKDPKECIVVTKNSKEDGGGFSIVLLMMNGANGETPTTMKAIAEERPIDELILLLRKDPNNLELQRLVPTFHRYELDLDGQSYLIGSNPIARQKTLHKLKINNDIFKLTGKQNVYFYSKDNHKQQGGATTKTPKVSKRSSFIKSLRPEQRSVVKDEDKILALFRPHEKRFKKKVIKTLSSTNATASNDTDDIEEYNYIENNQYYKPGDGLNQLNPRDDSPNATKIGWITIFEDVATTELWEVVLGYTFAVGFDRIIDEYTRE